MDEDKIFKLTLQSGHLMFKFNSVYGADNFPLHMPTNSSAILNESPASSPGSHWIVLAKRCAYFADPLCSSLVSDNKLEGNKTEDGKSLFNNYESNKIQETAFFMPTITCVHNIRHIRSSLNNVNKSYSK